MPTIRNMTHPHEIAAALVSTIDMLDTLRVTVRDRELLAEVDRRIAGSAHLLLGTTFLERRHITPRVAEIMAEVDAASRQPARRASA